MSISSEWKKEAKKITPDEWLDRLSKVTDRRERIKAACIVGWDFFGDRLIRQRCTRFDSEVTRWTDEDDIPQNQLAKVLVSIGYPEEAARERAFSAKRMKVKDTDLGIWDGETVVPDRDYAAHRNCGADAVFCGICEQSINDVKTLVAKGVIVDGKLDPAWPPRNCLGINGYTGRSEVADLLDWVINGSLEDMMKELGLNLDMDVVFKELGLPRRAVHAGKTMQHTKPVKQRKVA